jgi:hypothetical protein
MNQQQTRDETKGGQRAQGQQSLQDQPRDDQDLFVNKDQDLNKVQ